MVVVSEPRQRAIAPGENIAVIGLGKMGLPMAKNLRAAGFEVAGFDVSDVARARAAVEGIVVCDSPRDAAARTAATVVMVGFDTQVVETVCGEHGVLEGAPAGCVIAICSSVEPQTVVDVARAAEARSVDVVDAPVCRGEPAAEDGSLLVLCGGEGSTIDRVEPVLAAIGSDLCRLGSVGAGQVGKMLNNYLLWASVVANHETMKLAGRLGVDLGALRAALMLSSGNNWALETWERSRPMPWAEEDMKVVLQYARNAELPMPAAGLTSELIKDIKLQKAQWTEGGGAAASMAAFTRAHL